MIFIINKQNIIIEVIINIKIYILSIKINYFIFTVFDSLLRDLNNIFTILLTANYLIKFLFNLYHFNKNIYQIFFL